MMEGIFLVLLAVVLVAVHVDLDSLSPARTEPQKQALRLAKQTSLPSKTQKSATS